MGFKRSYSTVLYLIPFHTVYYTLYQTFTTRIPYILYIVLYTLLYGVPYTGCISCSRLYHIFNILCNSHGIFVEEDKIQVWSDIAAACESGWDFSSRWFAKRGPFKNNIRGIRTSRIIPVDLNAFMCWNNFILSKLHSIVGNPSASEEYAEQYEAMKMAVSKTFWNEKDGMWYDLDLDTNNKTSRNYYASSLVPLFANCLHDSSDIYDRVVNYLKVGK